MLIGFYYFNDMFWDETEGEITCETVLLCWYTVFHKVIKNILIKKNIMIIILFIILYIFLLKGIRSVGGIGDYLKKQSYAHGKERWF